MKTIIYISLIFSFALLISSCDKKYTCVCHSVSKNSNIPIESIKTTKLGSKGYRKTCLSHETKSTDLKDCHLE